MSVKPFNRSTVESSARVTGSTVQRFNDSTINILSRQRTKKIDLRLLKQIAWTLLEDLELETVEIGINLVGAAEITRLNETYLHHKGSTDVIAFDYALGVPPSGGKTAGRSDRADRLKPEQQTLHGEIFICVDEALLQARRFGTSWQSEIVRYLVHGVLHLLGFDDASAGVRRIMKQAENRWLRRLARRFSLAHLSSPAKIPA
jgi:probable rRNA maturation factor